MTETAANGSETAADGMLAPRALKGKRSAKKSSKSTPVLETLAPAPEDAPMDVPDVPEEAPELPDSTLAFVAFELQSLLSNFGLSKSQKLLEELSGSDDKTVQLQSLLRHPLFTLDLECEQCLLALERFASPRLELSSPQQGPSDASSRKIKLLEEVPTDLDVTDWSSRSFYVENIPLHTSADTTLVQISDLFSKMLDTQIQIVRFPPLYLYEDETLKRKKPSNDASVSKEDRQKERKSKLPDGGGPFKGFAFIVVGDDAAAEKLSSKWGWAQTQEGPAQENGSDSSSSSEEVDAEAAKEVDWEQEASKSGLRALPIVEWFRLKSEYLAYQRQLNDLAEQEEREYENRYNNRRSSKYSSSRREPSPQPGRAVQSDWRDARNQLREETSKREQVQAAARYPESCVVEVTGLNPNSSRAIIKSLMQDAIQIGGGMEQDKVVFVEWTHGSTTAELRLSSAGGAVAIKMFFQGRGLVMKSEEADKIDKLESKPEEGSTPLEAQILEGEREKAFWSRIEVDDRATAYTKMQQRNHKRPWNDRKSDKGRTKHQRFD